MTLPSLPISMPRVKSTAGSIRAQVTTQLNDDSNNVKVSVCIANWNCKELLRACLDSLTEELQGIRLEVIVVDNASTDGAYEMVEAEFPKVRLLRNNTNLGFARASNQAAEEARGDYLFFLNNDTVVPPNALRRMIDYAQLHPELGMIGPRLRDGEGRLQISYRRRPTIGAMLHRTAMLRWTGLFKPKYDAYRRNTFEPQAVRRVDVLMGAALLIRRDRFEACGRWDEDFRFGVEDVELSTRVGMEYPLLYLPGVEIIHHGRMSSRQNVTFAAPNLLIGYARYFRKTGSSPYAIFAYKLVLTLDSPLQLAGKISQYLWRRIRGKRDKAAKSWGAIRGLWHFLTSDFLRFWRA